MYLKTVLIRFFKSFNYDFLRKHHPNAQPDPWELIDGAWFPFVRVPLMNDIRQWSARMSPARAICSPPSRKG